ncbi:uncharacterized protein EAE97_008363 [Botrytis byssoidea]|uniref:Uncharacterized protein n=1 Tax=Botrytis byssoidea TaxID=139641 RepID=A0A9P5IG80_9HELO|nr:uncharacterized protein EAE97_008363 [Botrytis byssoidea]KAF7935456.1 hypothetical protein EAE97_008363 [Botrytis byssoidea]
MLDRGSRFNFKDSLYEAFSQAQARIRKLLIRNADTFPQHPNYAFSFWKWALQFFFLEVRIANFRLRILYRGASSVGVQSTLIFPMAYPGAVKILSQDFIKAIIQVLLRTTHRQMIPKFSLPNTFQLYPYSGGKLCDGGPQDHHADGRFPSQRRGESLHLQRELSYLCRSAGIPRYIDLKRKQSIPATISEALPPAKADKIAAWHAGLKAWQNHDRG